MLDVGGSQSGYSFETRVATARSVVDEGLTRSEAMARFGIRSESPIARWVKAYREGGAEALRPKPKGRPRGSGSRPRELTREQELERKVARLEAEVAYQKNDSPEGGEALSNRERAAAVSELSGQHPLSDLLDAAGLPRSSYYYSIAHPKAPTRPELWDKAAEIFSRTANGCGHRQIAMCLRAEEGITIADKTVLRMMHGKKGFRPSNANTSSCVGPTGTRVPKEHQKGAPEPRPERLENRTIM